MSPAAYKLLSAQANAKGEVLNTARVAGILAAKRCAELIPLCHSLPLGFAGIEFQHDDATHSITVKATCSTDYKTGVEMEAMTACSIAALTIYDMCKAADKGIVLEHIRSEEHTSELQSIMRISFAVLCLKKQTQNTNPKTE